MNTLRTRFFVCAAGLLFGMAAFPDAVLAAEQTNKWGIWRTVIGPSFNLLFVVGVLVWALRKPLAAFFTQRTQTIHEQLAEAQEARRLAEARVAELESRMSRLDDELKEIKQNAEREAQAEHARLSAMADQDVKKIIDRARQEIDGLTRAAQKELKSHIAELSVQLAEENIRKEITDVDRGRLFTKFVTRLGEKQ
jgi:F-type H+-transporting ATPase subunit b